MKLFKILAVFTLLFSSISPTTLVYAVSSLTPESSESANEEAPTEPIAEPQVEEASAVAEPVAEEASAEPVEPSTVEPQTEPVAPVPETAVPSPQNPDLPNIPQYRGELRSNGESTYRATAQPGFNAGVSNLSELGPNVGDSISYSFTIPTHSFAHGNGNDWIAHIVGNNNIGIEWFDGMSYGRPPNHTSAYLTTYQIGRTEVVEVGGASGDLSITSNHTINNNNFTMTMSGTITRTRASNRTDYQLTAGIHNLVLGATAVPSWGPLGPVRIEDVPINYLSIGNFTVNTRPAPTVEITANPESPLALGEVRPQAQKDSLRVRVNGILLPPDSYEIIESNLGLWDFIGIAGLRNGWVRIRYRLNGTVHESGRIHLQVPVVWGDSIVFGGSSAMSNRTVAAFTLHHRGARPLVTAAMGRDSTGPNAFIDTRYAGQNYYNFSWYDLSQKNSADLTNVSANQAVTAKGDERRSDVLNRWTTQTVNYGDVVRTWVADPEKNAVTNSMTIDAPFVFNGGEVYYEITTNGYRKLDINTLTPTEQSIEHGTSQASLDSQVSQYLDTSGKENLRIVGFVDYPDTSTPGEKTGTIRVEETLSTGKTVTYDYTVPFVVTSKLEVTAKPDSKVLLGTDMNTVDLRQFLDVEVDGEKLDDDSYEVEMTSAPIATDTVSIVGRPQSIRVTVNGTTLSQDTSVNIGIVWGNSIVYGTTDAMSVRSAAAFTLHHRGAHPSITAVTGRNNLPTNNFVINENYLGQNYYNFSWYDFSQKNTLDLTNDSANQAVSARGGERQQDVLSRWTTQTVNYGDVVRTWVADPTKNAVTENEQFVSNGGEVYYEITAGGYRALNINKLTTSSHTISQGMTESELDSQLAEFLDVSSVENINLDRFVQYPDTSVVGTTIGRIRVTETLSTGKTVSYDYEISFTVENAPPTADPIAQELHLGESLPDSPMDLLENVSDDRDDPSALKATYLNRPNIDRVGEMTASIQLEDSWGAVSVIEVPITVKWGSTLKLKGYGYGTVGVYSLNKNANGAMQIVTTKGEIYSLTSQVHQLFPDTVYYSIEVLSDGSRKFMHEVTGGMIVEDSINQFNNGTPLAVAVGDVVKVYHIEEEGSNNYKDKNLLMENEQEKNYTYGTNYVYYKVTEDGFEPMPPIFAVKPMKQDFVLGENTSGLDLHDLLEEVTLNDTVIPPDQYEVERLTDFDTSLVGDRNVKVKVTSIKSSVSLELDIPYEVKWGSTISLRGLSDRTVGAYSLTRSTDGTLRLHSTFGDNRTNQGSQVHSYYGSSVYYSLEVLDGETSTYQYEVTGNAIIQNAINGFNQGQPLEVSAGNVIKVFHGESHSRSRLMVNEVAENYSFGTPFSYYRVTDNGLVPIKHLEAEAVPQTFHLGENTDGRDLNEFVTDVQVNGVAVDASEYEISLRSEVNTTLIDTREVEVEIRTTDGLGILRTTVPYEVKWGSTISLRGLGENTVGSYSLIKGGNGKLQLHSTFGDNSSRQYLNVHPNFGNDVYYSIEVFNGETSTYQYEVKGNAVIRDAINGFNQGNPLEVSAGNIIKVYHAESRTRSRLMVNEVAENYTFGTLFSYYRVTDNGLVPIKQLEAEAAPQTFNLGESADGRHLKELVRNVRVNGTVVDASEYEVVLRSELDTSLIGTREIDIEVRTTDGLGIVQLTVPYEVKWGNSIIAQDQAANSDKTVAVLSLTEENNLPKLTATQGDGLDSFSPVASAPQAVFYRGDLTSPRFSLLTNNLTVDAQTLRSNWNNVLRQNELAYGDVLSFEVFDSAGNNLLGNKTAVSRNEQLVKEVIGYPQAFYEMTANGFNLLRINQLKVETQTIESGLTEEELSQNIESYLSTDGFDTIHVTKFIQYPDTSKAGTSNGIIEVEEALATGGTATYNYTVPFIVENSTEWIDVKIPKKLLFGTTDVNKGMVSSPLYYIENAGTRNLKVSVEEINITNNTNNLELLRTADADPSAERAAAKLRMNYKTSNILVDLYESTPNQVVAELAPNEQTQFMIEGQYFGNYQQEVNIGLDIRYRFEVAS
ncbi:putative mucin/carbohydrate-binding domain-containing protein [Enterococcus sp. DIV1283b]|uniref:putative mucin/carbohydrate-binding domain-containing protein n=1 Tax=Enterococcus sp. DIV1283b TaxID=2774745 RepID=UPI003F22DC50